MAPGAPPIHQLEGYSITFKSPCPHPERPRFVRRGRASKGQPQRDLDVDSSPEELLSDVEVEELGEWLSTRAQGPVAALLPQQQLVRKFLAPGTVMDLYEHYYLHRRCWAVSQCRASALQSRSSN